MGTSNQKERLPAPWPGFHGGGLLLPLRDAWFTPSATSLRWNDLTLCTKDEYHVTLLNRSVATCVRREPGDAGARRVYEAEAWTIERTGDGALLQAIKAVDGRPAACASIIEHITLPALQRFRDALRRASLCDIPDAPPHVTLFAGGDPEGIGLADYQALRDRQVLTLRLPGIANRPPPPLQPTQHAAYCAALYALDGLGTSVRIGTHCPIVDAELGRRGVERAAVITAFNPFSTQADPAGNQLRQQWLREVLRREGLEALEAEGQDPEGHWPSEPSLLVFGTTPCLENRLMRDFEQHAVVVVQTGTPARLALHPDCRAGAFAS